MQERKLRTQCGHHQLGRADVATWSLGHHESGDIGRSGRFPWANLWDNAARKVSDFSRKNHPKRVQNRSRTEANGPLPRIRKAWVGGSNPFVGSLTYKASPPIPAATLFDVRIAVLQ